MARGVLDRVFSSPEFAAILKSPLFDFTEDELFAVAHDRNNTSLYRRLLALEENGQDDYQYDEDRNILAYSINLERGE